MGLLALFPKRPSEKNGKKHLPNFRFQVTQMPLQLDFFVFSPFLIFLKAFFFIRNPRQSLFLKRKFNLLMKIHKKKSFIYINFI
jgi:hypothetical protein